MKRPPQQQKLFYVQVEFCRNSTEWRRDRPKSQAPPALAIYCMPTHYEQKSVIEFGTTESSQKITVELVKKMGIPRRSKSGLESSTGKLARTLFKKNWGKAPLTVATKDMKAAYSAFQHVKNNTSGEKPNPPTPKANEQADACQPVHNGRLLLGKQRWKERLERPSKLFARDNARHDARGDKIESISEENGNP